MVQLEDRVEQILNSFNPNRGLLKLIIKRLAENPASKYELRQTFFTHSVTALNRSLEELKYKKHIEVKNDGRYYIRT